MTVDEKLHLLDNGVLAKIVLMIVERSGNVLDGGTTDVQRRISYINEMHVSKNRDSNRNKKNGFVSQIQIINGVKMSSSKQQQNDHHQDHSMKMGKNQSSIKLKGVGYGYGSTRSRWDVERAIEGLVVKEEQLVWLMNCLTSYIYCSNPDFSEPVEIFKVEWSKEPSHIKQELVDMIAGSAIIASFDYHLKNESLFDVSERIDFYQSLIDLVCSITVLLSEFYRDLPPARSIFILLNRFSRMLNGYALNFGKGHHKASSSSSLAPPWTPNPPDSGTRRYDNSCRTYVYSGGQTPLTPPDFRLIDFASRVEKCCRLISLSKQTTTRKLIDRQRLNSQTSTDLGKNQQPDDGSSIGNKQSTISTLSIFESVMPPPTAHREESIESEYNSVLKPLQIVYEKFIGDFGKLSVPFAFTKEAKSVNPFSPSLKERSRRIARELASLHNALPMSASNSIFLCVDESEAYCSETVELNNITQGRIDIMKVLITGPDDTPYQNGLFEFDLFFPSTYPFSPPKVSFLTTARGEVRFNPNLYQDGKICLSILNTWEGRPEEKWNPFCSLLQVLVSIQALIFVRDPYFNEPGFERYLGTEKGAKLSESYNLQLRQATVCYGILEQLKHPPDHFREVIRRHCRVKKSLIEEQLDKWIRDAYAAYNKNAVSTTAKQAATAGAAADDPTTAAAIDVKSATELISSSSLSTLTVLKTFERNVEAAKKELNDLFSKSVDTL
uniref:UBC core domain-containing protein n=2 Tax=Romanomermis culicivorax TaxID=13658 RepID=A0A915HRV7_ROMCU